LSGDVAGSRPLVVKMLISVAAVLSVAIFTVSVGGYTLYRYFDDQISRIRLSIDGRRPADAATGTENFLLVGSDSRAGTGSEYSSQGEVAGERSDTTMLAHLDADGTSTLVAFPRDTLVRIPGHGRGKLNTAITLGGPSLLIGTLEHLTEIRIDHYVSLDLAGFKRMTDAIGGVTVCVKPLPDGSTGNLHDVWSGWRGHVGENAVGGEQALAFVRQRHGLPGGDFDRIRRQQQFISAVFKKATSGGVLTSPGKLEGLLRAATGALTVDDGTTGNDLRRLATRLRGMSADQIRFETIPVHAPTAAEGGTSTGELPPFGSVQIYDPAELESFLGPLRGHRRGPGDGAGGAAPATGTPSPSGATTAKPSTVRVNVYNGSGRTGLAGAVATGLAGEGFQVGPARTWPDGAVTTSQVRYAPGYLEAARAVAAAVPDARLVPDRSLGAAVSLVLGRSFTGLRGIGGATAPGANGAGASGVTSPPTAGPSVPSTSTAAQLTSSCTY
jgi:LCP family protein required for cell wall assembly